MKLTEYNKDKIHITKHGNFRYKKETYIYGGLCKNCGGPFLIVKSKACKTKHCSISCSKLGQKHSIESKQKMSIALTGRKHTKKTRQKMSESQVGEGGHFFGKKHTDKTKQIISKALKKEKCHLYKGDVVKLNLPLYDTYAPQFPENFEQTRFVIENGLKLLEVKCHNSSCKKWFRPKLTDVKNRIRIFKSKIGSQNNFYCSPECKISCSTFGQIKYFKGQTHKNDIIRTYTKDELKIWAREVLRRANFICACCGESATIGHHRKSKIEFPEFALDPTYGIALCRLCHMPIFHSGENGSIYYVDKCR